MNSVGGQFRFLLYEIYVQNQLGVWNFEILVKDSNTDSLSSIVARIESSFMVFVPILICELCLKNNEGEAEGIIK